MKTTKNKQLYFCGNEMSKFDKLVINITTISITVLFISIIVLSIINILN